MDAFILLRFGIWTGDDIDVKNDFLYQRPLIPSNWYICSHHHASNISTHRIIQFLLTLTPISATLPNPYHPSSPSGCPHSTTSSPCQSLSSLSGELLVGGRELRDSEKSRISDLEPASMNLRKHHPICTAVEVSLPSGST